MTSPFNLTSLLKANILEEGIEDIHFHQVAFNSHKLRVLNKREYKEMVRQQRRHKYERGQIDTKDYAEGTILKN